MARKVKEWIGKTDDERPPPRVLVRIFAREGGRCHISGRIIRPSEPWQADHKIAIINGGRNSEDNIFPALVDKHKVKTKKDVAEKSLVAALANSHVLTKGKTGSIAARVKPGPTDKPKRPERERAPGRPAIFRRFTAA